MFPKDNVYSFTQDFCWLQSQPTGHPKAEKKMNIRGLRSNVISRVSQITTCQPAAGFRLALTSHSTASVSPSSIIHAVKWAVTVRATVAAQGRGQEPPRVTARRCSLGHEGPRRPPNGNTDPVLSPGPARASRWVSRSPRCGCHTWGNAVWT